LAGGQVLTLSVREFELLVALARRLGTIVRRDEPFSTVWGGDLRPRDRSVDVYISKLRAKLERAMPDRRYIHTHPGFGYRFQPQPSPRPEAAASDAGDIEAGANGLLRNVHTGVPRRQETGAATQPDGRLREPAPSSLSNLVRGDAVTSNKIG